MDFVWDKIQIVDGQPSEPILIIARNFRYAREWCRIHNLNLYSPMIRLATCLGSLQGISGMYYVDLGTDDADFRTLIERLKALDVIKPLLTPNGISILEPRDQTTYHMCTLPLHTHSIPLRFETCYEPGCWTWESKHSR